MGERGGDQISVLFLRKVSPRVGSVEGSLGVPENIALSRVWGCCIAL